MRYSRAPSISSADVDAWKERLVGALVEAGATRRSATSTVNRLDVAISAIDRVLHAVYGTPHLGNIQDPTSEFVYIALSRKTVERAYQRAFQNLGATEI